MLHGMVECPRTPPSLLKRPSPATFNPCQPQKLSYTCLTYHQSTSKDDIRWHIEQVKWHIYHELIEKVNDSHIDPPFHPYPTHWLPNRGTFSHKRMANTAAPPSVPCHSTQAPWLLYMMTLDTTQPSSPFSLAHETLAHQGQHWIHANQRDIVHWIHANQRDIVHWIHANQSCNDFAPWIFTQSNQLLPTSNDHC